MVTRIDADDHVLGRLATHVVDELKSGEAVEIYNAERVIVKGRPGDIIERYQDKYERGSREHGPDYPKTPARIVRRTVRGMLPGKADGRDMYSRLKVYPQAPDQDADQVDDAKVTSLKGGNFLRMGEIAENMG